MFNHNGGYIGTFCPAESSSDMGFVIKQVELYSNEKKRAFYARSIIIASVRNMMATIRYYNKQNRQMKYGIALERMKEQIRYIKKAGTVNEIMTAEARCRMEYYDCFTEFIMNPVFSFSGRTRRPPKDLVNAMLSFGNVYLYNRISFVHSSMRRKNNLCLDLADIYKPLTVDRTVLTLVNKHMIDPALHFSKEDGACLINEEGISVFLKEMKRKLSFRHQINGRNSTFLQIMKTDIQNLAICIETGRRFKPFTGE